MKIRKDLINTTLFITMKDQDKFKQFPDLPHNLIYRTLVKHVPISALVVNLLNAAQCIVNYPQVTSIPLVSQILIKDNKLLKRKIKYSTKLYFLRKIKVSILPSKQIILKKHIKLTIMNFLNFSQEFSISIFLERLSSNNKNNIPNDFSSHFSYYLKIFILRKYT